MKKIGLIAGIAILALAAVTCTLFDAEEGGVPKPRLEIDAEGNEWMTLDIVTGNTGARNMSLETAKVGINYYEVLFQNATNVFRTAGPRGKTLTIRLPVGFDLAGADKAIVFAGNLDRATDERILLATGIVTHTNWDGSTGTAVASVQTTTTNIRFLLFAVETYFNTSVDSNFQITATVPTDQAGTGVTYVTTGTVENHNRVLMAGSTQLQLNHQPNMDNGDIYPYWKLPKAVGTTPATATATFKNGVEGTHTAGVMTQLSLVRFDSYGIFTGYKEDGVTAVEAALDTTIHTGTLSDEIALPGTYTIAIKMAPPPLNQGFCVLVINTPVKAITTDETKNPNGEWWSLKNGVYDYEIHDNNLLGTLGEGDLPFEAHTALINRSVSLGGALMLCIGEPVSAGSGRPIMIIIEGWGNT